VAEAHGGSTAVIARAEGGLLVVVELPALGLDTPLAPRLSADPQRSLTES
jgi:hypothetical protein